jgi:hypothetical protein
MAKGVSFRPSPGGQFSAVVDTVQLRSPPVPQILKEAAEINDGGRFAHRSARTTQVRA